MFLLTLLCVIVTIQTFTDTGLLPLNKNNIQLLLMINVIFFILLTFGIFLKLFSVYIRKKNNELGSTTSKSLVFYFLSISIIPCLLIAIFPEYSLILEFKTGVIKK